ncbi:DUF3365 domain-containing protein [Bergeyella zoohelcum]|uniref:Tll0287-like domain-containing protein n=1 Tax=Bergeyella zoohelcum TaxID=1015 RepID=UPI002A90FEB0|nr:DUF3365 domain-containing protein [Bergeyella zoohelcum]MDY6026322.1 DUF3365 domain-containing protein [Bergeyella zoohelcum]
MKKIFYSAWAAVLFSCQPSHSPLSESEQSVFLAKGDSIATQSQLALLGHVSAQMKAGGASQAVNFCNEKAIPLTDSLSQNYQVEIQRLTNKNRNPNNALSTEQDKEAWQQLFTQMQSKTMPNHLLIEGEDAVYYYKAIPLGMPTCLACHGNPSKDIAPETLAIISSKYPEDKATGYTQGELRGMWKIKMNK